MDGDMRRGMERYWKEKEERAQYPYTCSQSSQVYMGHMMYIILLQLVTACSLFYTMF